MQSTSMKPLAAAAPTQAALDDEALQTSLSLFQTTFMYATIGVALVSPQGKFLRVNPALCDMLGYTDSELAGMNFADVTYPDDRSIGIEFLANARAGKAVTTRFEKRYLRKDGSILWVDISSTAVRAPTGELQYLVTHIQDITAAHERQEALLHQQTRLDELVAERTARLSESEALYHSLFENLSSIIVMFDPVSGAILDANPAACAFFGQPIEKLIQVNMKELVSLSLAESDRHGERIRSGEKRYMEAAYRSANGDLRQLGIYPGTIQHQGAEVVLSVMHDITERKRAEEDLHAAEEELRKSHEQVLKFASQVPGMLYQFERRPDGTFCVPFATEAIRDLYGCSPEDVRDDFTPIAKTILPEDLPKVEAAIHENSRTLVPFQIEYRIQIPGQPLRWVLAHSKPEARPDGSVVWNGFNTDITAQKNLEASLLEHIKELNCLREVNLLVENQAIAEADLSQGVVEGLARALQRPQACGVALEVGGVRYAAGLDLDALPKRLAARVVVHGQQTGTLTAGYPAELDFMLPEEQDLLENLARILSYWLERKAFETEIRKLSRAVEQSPVSIVITDVHGIIEYVNPGFTSLTGYSFEEALNQNPRILQSGYTSREEYKALWDTILAGNIWQGEFRNRKKNGEFYWEAATISPILGEGGAITHFLAVKENITERKESQQRIVDALAFNESILNTSPIGITIYNAAGDCVSANLAAYRITGAPPDALLKQNFHQIENWKLNGLYGAALQALGSGRQAAIRTPVVSTFGKKLWLNANFSTFQTGGERHLLFMFEDDTDRQTAEENLRGSNDKLASLVNELERGKLEADLLRQMSDLLQVCATMAEAYAVIEQFAPRIFVNTQGMVVVTSTSGHTMEAASVWGDSLASEIVFAPQQCWALRRGQTHAVDGHAQGLACLHMPKNFSGCYLDAPLLVSGEIMGLLHLEWQSDLASIAPAQEQAKIFADHVALSLSNIKLRETLHNQSVRDPLTHTFNRRYMEETLEREMPRARRKRGSIGVIMLDIDHFKQFNDTYGHAAGDLILTRLSELVRTQVRGEDIVCRMGGEEFLIILPDANREVSLQRAEVIRAAAQGLSIEYNSRFLGSISVSLGVAVYPQNGSTTEQLLKTADEALYRAKAAGRNRVEAAAS